MLFSVLTRRKLASIDNFVGFLDEGVIGRATEDRPRKGHETCAGRFEDTEGSNELQEGINTTGLGRSVEVEVNQKFSGRILARKKNLQLNNAGNSADIQDLSAKLMGEICDSLKMLVLVTQSFGSSQLAWVKVVS